MLVTSSLLARPSGVFFNFSVYPKSALISAFFFRLISSFRIKENLRNQNEPWPGLLEWKSQEKPQWMKLKREMFLPKFVVKWHTMIVHHKLADVWPYFQYFHEPLYTSKCCPTRTRSWSMLLIAVLFMTVPVPILFSVVNWPIFGSGRYGCIQKGGLQHDAN